MISMDFIINSVNLNAELIHLIDMIYIYSTPQAVAETDYYFFKYLIRNVDLTFSQISHECHEVKSKLNSKESTILIGNLQGSGALPSQTPQQSEWKRSPSLPPVSAQR